MQAGRQPDRAPVEALVLEAEDEGQQVEGEGQHPEEGDHRHVLAQRARDREQEGRGHGGQAEPQHMVAEGGGRGCRCFDAGASGGPAEGERAGARRERIEEEARRPQPALAHHRQPRLDHERVAEQTQEGAEVREREEPVGRGVGLDPREPGLHQRSGCGEHQVGQAGARRQQRKDQGHRASRRIGLPGLTGREGRWPSRASHGEDHEGGREQPQVGVALPPWSGPHQGVGIGVPDEQRHLEEQHAGRPDGGGTPEPRQQPPGEDELDLEQQEGAEENGEAEARGGGAHEAARREGDRGAPYSKYPLTSMIKWTVPVACPAKAANPPTASSGMMALLARVCPAA